MIRMCTLFQLREKMISSSDITRHARVLGVDAHVLSRPAFAQKLRHPRMLNTEGP